MTPLQQFVQDLAWAFSASQYLGPAACSRSELAVDETNNVVVLFLRTQPRLSEWMFSTLPFEYPWPLLANHDIILHKLGRQIMEEQTVRLALSELMRAAMGGVKRSDCHGAIAGAGTFGATLYVPDVAESPEWRDLLLDPRYPNFDEQDETLPEFFVVHLPDDMPVEQLNDAQLRQLAALSIGWNFLEVPPNADLILAQAIRVWGTGLQVIAEY